MADTMKEVRRIAITGCTGSIGTALISLCIEEGVEVYAFVRGNSKRIDRIPRHSLVNIVECDLSDIAAYDAEQCPQCDVFYHLGWGATIGGGRNDMPTQIDNIKYTIDAVALAHRLGCHTFIGTGSQAEYGRYEGKLNADVPTNPENGYGIAKLAAGQMSRIECAKYDMKHIWTRILSVYGPNDGENTLISYVIRELKANHSPELTKCEQIWDYLYADDAGDAILSIAEKGMDGKAYPLGSGQGRKLSEYIEDIRQMINSSIEIKFGVKDYYPHQPMHLVADISELTIDTGWTPKVDFHKSIKSLTSL